MLTTGVVCRRFIGRAEELAYLIGRVFRQADGFSGGIVVRGDAGLGKTRLIEEFATAARERGARVGIGRAREYANAPYVALREALDALGIAPASDDGAGKIERFAAVAQALRAAATIAEPVAIVIEDAHVADSATVELVRYLAVELRDDPVLVVVTYRTEDLESDSARALALNSVDRDFGDILTLRPLDEKAVDLLLDDVLERVGREVDLQTRSRVAELSDGRPLFVEELLRSVLERGGDAPAVPTSLRASVRERFLTLSADDRDVILHAAVVGKRFSASLLMRLLQRDAAPIYAALRHARDLQLIVEETNDDEDGDRFAFRHALTREAVYAELLRAEARTLHAKVARTLADANPIDISAVAEHAWRARDGSEGRWNERAADAAIAVHAYADAIIGYERAYRSTTDVQRRGFLAMQIAEAAYALADYERAVDAFLDAGTLLANFDEERAIRARTRAARVMIESGRTGEGLTEALALIDATSNAELRFEARLMAAGLLAHIGRIDEALEHFAHMQASGVPADLNLEARYHTSFAFTLLNAGRSAESLATFEVGLDFAHRLAYDDVTLRTLNNFAVATFAWRSLDDARRLGGEAVELARTMRHDRHLMWTLANQALFAHIAGDPAARDAALAEASNLQDAGVPPTADLLGVQLGVLLQRGEDHDRAFAAARALLDELITARTKHRSGFLTLTVLRAMSRYGDSAGAEALAGAVYDGMNTVIAPYGVIYAAVCFGAPDVRAAARQGLRASEVPSEAVAARGIGALADARLAQRTRKREEAIAHAERAAGLLRSIGWDLFAAEADELAGRTAEAIAFYRSIGATADVARLHGDAPAQRRRGDAALTAREREIASLVAGGRTAKQIAETLVISERTVETHTAAVYRKLGVSGRAALADALRTR